MKRTFPIFIVMALCTVGCSTFEHDWQNASFEPAEVTGPWTGQWNSHGGSHTGGIRCLLTKQEDGKYSAYFRSTYGPGLALVHEHTMTLTPTDQPVQGAPAGAICFSGNRNIAQEGDDPNQQYGYDGWVTPMQFTFHYRSVIYTGSFDMTRPTAP